MTTYVVGIERQVQASQQRLLQYEEPVKDASEFLRSRRRELNAVRREILTRVAEEAREGRSEGIRRLENDEDLPEYMRFDTLAGRVRLPEGAEVVPPAEGQETPAPSYESVIRSEDDQHSPFASPAGPPPSDLPNLVHTPIFTRSTSGANSFSGSRSPPVHQERVQQVEAVPRALSIVDQPSRSRTYSAESRGQSPGHTNSSESTNGRQDQAQSSQIPTFAPPPGPPPPPSNPRFSFIDPRMSNFEPVDSSHTDPPSSSLATSLSSADLVLINFDNAPEHGTGSAMSHQTELPPRSRSRSPRPDGTASPRFA